MKNNMYNLTSILEDLDIKGKKSIAKAIYERVFTAPEARYCYNDVDRHFDCHPSVHFIKNDSHTKSFWWYKDIKFHLWNESRWDKVSKKLQKDNKRFSSKVINELITDIADGSVNGHSFMSFQGYFIDPYLKSKNVRDNEIQKFDKYFLGIM